MNNSLKIGDVIQARTKSGDRFMLIFEISYCRSWIGLSDRFAREEEAYIYVKIVEPIWSESKVVWQVQREQFYRVFVDPHWPSAASPLDDLDDGWDDLNHHLGIANFEVLKLVGESPYPLLLNRKKMSAEIHRMNECPFCDPEILNDLIKGEVV